MNTTTSSLESKYHTNRPVENSTKNELITTIGGVVPIAGFVVKLWVKILKISIKAAIWMLRKIPSPQKEIEKS
ncbi:hypothetical protein GCM10009119_33300 [Algoriphagus jejuensis]|uniref:Uncharacterized protein n=1 Tax=Algoriphagus jejuensis TaxID=419934 RepID=A0ABP3YG11_9BACT